MGDISINLKAPNGQVLNLLNNDGGSGKNLVNTVFSSQGTILPHLKLAVLHSLVPLRPKVVNL
jgi:hypothetical protein